MRHAHGFTLVEIMVVLVVMALLLAVALPSFLGQREKGENIEPQVSIAEVHKHAKGIWVENDGRYPSTASLLEQLEPGEPVYTYRASLPATSATISAYDVSVTVNGPDTATFCARSTTAQVFCARYDERGSLQVGTSTADNGEDRNLFASLSEPVERALLPGVAEAAPNGVIAQSAYKALGMGTGGSAEEDALAALPTAEAPPTWRAGPGDSGKPTWDPHDRYYAEGQAAAPPEVALAVKPDAETTSQSAVLTFVTSGGPASATECKLDGATVDCGTGTVSANALAYGGHSFSVEVRGPGGSDSDATSWVINQPVAPTDHIELDGFGDYASASGAYANRPTGAFEVGAWVRLNSLPSSRAAIVSHGCSESNSNGCRSVNPGWLLSIESSGKVHFEVRAEGSGDGAWRDENWGSPNQRSQCFSAENGSKAALSVGKWHYISGAYDPAGRLRTYVNGRLQACSASGVGNPNILAEEDNLLIGAQVDKDHVVGSFLNGSIAATRMTRGGAAAHVVDPGPSDKPGVLYTPAENGRPATFLFSFSDSKDAMGNFGDLVFSGDAALQN